MRALVLQHIACEPPGVYEDVLVDTGAEIHRVELDEGEPLPSWRDFDLVVAMGGPMSVNDELRDEKQLVHDAVAAGVPGPHALQSCVKGVVSLNKVEL